MVEDGESVAHLLNGFVPPQLSVCGWKVPSSDLSFRKVAICCPSSTICVPVKFDWCCTLFLIFSMAERRTWSDGNVLWLTEAAFLNRLSASWKRPWRISQRGDSGNNLTTDTLYLYLTYTCKNIYRYARVKVVRIVLIKIISQKHTLR